MQASDVNVVHLESNEQLSAFEKGEVDGAVTFDPYRAQFLQAGAKTLFDSTQIPGEIVDLLAVRASVLEKRPKAVQALLTGWFGAIDYMARDPKDAARRMGIRQQTSGEQFLEAQKGLHVPIARREPQDARRVDSGARGDRTPADGADAGGEAAEEQPADREAARAGSAGDAAEMKFGLPASLKLTVPLILLVFAATLSTVNLLYHVPQAERAAEEDNRKRLAQEMSRLQSTLEYLLLKGDLEVAQREIAVLAHNHDVILAALTDDRHAVIAATRYAWLGRQIHDVLPQFDLDRAEGAIRERRAGVTTDAKGDVLLGYAGVLMGGERDELRPSRTGSLFLAYDLKRYKAEARALVNRQSLYWSGWVTALALTMWLVFHFLLTRRTARLVRAAEQLAAGNPAVRSNLKGRDELGKLSVAFDAMALDVAETQRRLRQDIEARARVQRELENSEARLQQILNNATAVVFVKDTEGRYLFVNRQWERLFHVRQADAVGKSDREVLPEADRQDLSRQRYCSSCSATCRWSSRRPRRSTTACTRTSRSSSRCTTRTAPPTRYAGFPPTSPRRSAPRRSSRGSANRCTSAKNWPRWARCSRASRTSSTTRFRSSSRARCCSKSKATPPRKWRRSRSAPPPSAVRASCGPSSRWPGSSSRNAVPWRSTK